MRQIPFFVFGQRKRNANFCALACGNGKFAVQILFVYLKRARVVVEHVRLFRNGKPVFCDRFRELQIRRRKAKRARTEIMHGKAHRIFARLCRVVAKFDFRSVIVFRVFYGKIRARLGDNVVQATQARALFSGRVRQAFLIHRRRSRTHHELVGKTVDKHGVKHAVLGCAHGKRRLRFDIISNERHNPRHVGRRHGRTALFAVATGDGGRNFAAVRRDFGLNF